MEFKSTEKYKALYKYVIIIIIIVIIIILLSFYVHGVLQQLNTFIQSNMDNLQAVQNFACRLVENKMNQWLVLRIDLGNNFWTSSLVSYLSRF